MADRKARESTLFLERQSYRRRRLVDGIKLVPLLGLVLFFLPMLWAGKGTTSAGLIYVFAAWGVLIAAMAVLATRIRKDAGSDQPGQNSDEFEDL